VVAKIAREAGALTVGVVTRPFAFEGIQCKKRSTAGIEKLARSVDALIVIPNDRLLQAVGKKTTLKDSFKHVDAVCLNATRGISDLMMVKGLINVDFADVRTIMSGAGRTLMGAGRASGGNRCIEAARMAMSSPLLEDASINGATGVLVNVSGGPDMTLSEVSEALGLISEAADRDCNIIFGSVIDPNLGDEVHITVIATGFQSKAATAAISSPDASKQPTAFNSLA
jgi:cell division protein FtsZ